MQITDLLCEYQKNPLGIGVPQPRLSWKLVSDRRGARQTAYQVQVAGSEEALRSGRADLWDSGKVLSDRSIQVPYDGAPLDSGRRAWWRVHVWDENGQVTADSEPAWWEMGLLERADWQGRWIGSSLVGGPRTAVPCPFLRTGFALDKPVESARLYVTALGLYECWCNGRRVGQDELLPGWTEYAKRVQYRVYDVSDLIHPGENVLGAVLGDGWYCGHIEMRGRQRYGDRPKLLAQLVVRYADGTSGTIVTNSSWKTAFGPILESDLLMGESYDARLDLGNWKAPGFDDGSWRAAEEFADPGIQITASPGPAVRRQEEIHPIKEPREFFGWPSRWIFDLGQNMVGRVRLKVSGPAGTTVTLRHAEMLNPDGTLYTANLRTAAQTDHYTLRGDGEEVYEPRFTFHGFRYVELIGLPGKPAEDAVTGIVLHSDTPPTGTFACSDPLVNQLQKNITWGQKGNFVDIPTDCPQRDERLGWTGDAQVFVRTAAFNCDVAPFFTKWLQDMRDSQTEQGGIPAIIPATDAGSTDGGPAWADAAVICPWTIFLAYDDRRMLEEHYDCMTRFLHFEQETSRDGIRCDEGSAAWGGFGDWLSTNAETPRDLIGTAFFAHSTGLVARIARVLGKTADAEKYERLFAEIKRAFINRFVTPAGLIAGQTQTAYVLALHFGLLPEEQRATVAAALVQDIKGRGMHLSTGFVGTPYLTHVLTQMGHLDVAYALLFQKTWPSWLYPVTKGATTIWERWDGWTEEKGFQDPAMNSFNHYAYGAVGEWLYGTVAGIDLDPAEPGYKHILLQPRPGGELTSAQATLESLYGRIVSEWMREDGRLQWHVVVPPNTRATAYVPASAAAVVTEGGAPAQEAAGISLLRREPEAAVYTLAPGDYHFAVTEQSHG